MVKIKICGITNLEDASMAVRLGAQAIGFIFAPSPRQVKPEKARDIIKEIPPFVKSVGVFVDEDPAVIREIIQFCGIDLIQFHGGESPDICGEFMPRSIKAIRIKDDLTPGSIESYRGKIRALLLDTFSEGRAGGTGRSFDWNLAIKIREMGIPIILAGGLGPHNIEDAISRVRPYAVDVNSGIEERPGKKNHKLMKEMFERIAKTRR